MPTETPAAPPTGTTGVVVLWAPVGLTAVVRQSVVAAGAEE